MLEYVIVWWNTVRIIHVSIYTLELAHSPLSFSLYSSLFLFPLSLYVARSLASSFSEQLPVPESVRFPRNLLFLVALPGARSASISYTNPTYLPESPPPSASTDLPWRSPRHTYIVSRNAESYSVSLDSLKQVLMSCAPSPPPISFIRSLPFL